MRRLLVQLLAVCQLTGSSREAPSLAKPPETFDEQRLEELRDEVLAMFEHAFDSYMKNAYPWDELKPLSCSGRRWDQRERGTLDDSLGGYALTLVDTLDTLLIMGWPDRFEAAIATVERDVHFDRNITVSVFEANIRVLGGLLSAHQLASSLSPFKERYSGRLLALATDLGERLLPAFETPTGLPLHRVNLRHGAMPRESRETCPAAAGTLLLEVEW